MLREKAKRFGDKQVMHGPIVQADSKIDLSNYLGQVLLGNLFIGTPP